MISFDRGAYAWTRHRAALALEPLDALRGGRLTHPVRAEIEGARRPAFRDPEAPYAHPMRPGASPPESSRHNSCLHVLLHHQTLNGSLDLRIYDHVRRYAPRRYAVTLPSMDEEDGNPPGLRLRRPVIYPGAAYDAIERSTGIRGRVLRDDRPMRWARIEARAPGPGGLVVGRAHGDDRGEFLLLLGPAAVPMDELPAPIDLDLVVFGPEEAPEPVPADLPQRDPLWDLPVEPLPAPGPGDPIADDVLVPGGAGYVAAQAPWTVTLDWGRILSARDGVVDFEFTPSAP